ncbi:unnamed protein product [Clonostachys solani]|uniref:Methyltransferase type 11 domain-containing protein n=1 Tax=Clonostachys solani TaxID=160281 RepID=A0A9P0EET3_9HYPO|nr:unnamed protein product [Clonostachys solani]
MSQLAKAYSLTDVNDTRSLYDDWAANYDLELTSKEQDYVGPVVAVAHVLKDLGVTRLAPETQILDAGCGTGLVGTHLAQVGGKKVDGVDLSPGMLKEAAKTGAYRDLQTADLTRPLAFEDNKYDVLVCVGTFTQAHVGPVALDEFVRVTKPGGSIVATVLGSIFESGGYAAKIESLENQGKVKLVSAEMEDYRRGPGVRARMVVLKVLS